MMPNRIEEQTKNGRREAARTAPFFESQQIWGQRE
jgi:hypothetical protein